MAEDKYLISQVKTRWDPFYTEEEERALNARQQAEAMDRHAESMALQAMRREASGKPLGENLTAAIVAARTPRNGETNARS